MAEDRLPFRAEENALIKFGDPGTAPLINYNVPQPAEYNGRYYLDLALPPDALKPALTKPTAPAAEQRPGTDYSLDEINGLVGGLVKDADPVALAVQPEPTPIRAGTGPAPAFDRIFDAALAKRRASGIQGRALLTEDTAAARLVPGQRPPYLRRLDAMVGRLGAPQLAARVAKGERVVETRTLNGDPRYELRAPPAPGRPRFAVIHQCRLSSYLGEYGAGRTVSTFSLLPGEKHEIEIKTYKRTKTKATESSSILDSYEEETADEFQSDLTQESSSSSAMESSLAVSADVQASATWGWGSANASAGVDSSSSSKREDFAKNVASTTQKHAAKAAAKRQVEVNTTNETETEEGEERAIKRTLENINVGRTLNFVMRQMNQVFVSVLTVTDIRLGFASGQPGHYQEYTLPELGDFLDQHVQPAARDKVKTLVWNALFLSFDWRAELKPLVEAMALAPVAAGGLLTNASTAPAKDPLKASFWRFPRHETTLDRTRDGVAVTVPGVVLAVTRSILPTDGVIVEALLGQGNALDAYSLGLQVEAVREKLAANDRVQLEAEIGRSKLQAVADGDGLRAELLKGLFPSAAKADG
jgi:hypothetical protein